eukprot:jgi/Mesvir1/19592/Mv09893-RA.1
MPPKSIVDVEGQTLKPFSAPRPRPRSEGKDHRPVLARAKDTIADVKLGVFVDWKLWGVLASVVMIGILIGRSFGGGSTEAVHATRYAPATAQALVAPEGALAVKPAAEAVQVSKPVVVEQEALKPAEPVPRADHSATVEQVEPAEVPKPTEAADQSESKPPEKIEENRAPLFDDKNGIDEFSRLSAAPVPAQSSPEPAQPSPAPVPATPQVSAADLFAFGGIQDSSGLAITPIPIPSPTPAAVTDSPAGPRVTHDIVIPGLFEGGPDVTPRPKVQPVLIPFPVPTEEAAEASGVVTYVGLSSNQNNDKNNNNKNNNNNDKNNNDNNEPVTHEFAEFAALEGESISSTLERRHKSIQGQGGGLKVVSRWNGGQCRSLYKGSVSNAVKYKPERVAFKKRPLLLDMYKTTAGWRPTGAEMPDAIFMQRHVTWEDSHIKDPNGNLQVDVDETLPLWLGTHVRAVPMFRPKNWHNFKTLEAYPFVAPAIPRTALNAIKVAATRLGHQLGPMVKTSFEMSENLERSKVVAFVRDPIDRLLAAYTDMNHELSLKGHVPENAIRFLDKKSRFYRIKEEPERFRTFVQDLKNGLWFWRAEEVISQSYFLAATDEHGSPMHYHFIGKVESLSNDWLSLEKLLKVHTPAGLSQNAPNDTYAHGALGWFDERTLKMVCEIYAQDFLCLDYPVPSQCHTVIRAALSKKYTPVRPEDLAASAPDAPSSSQGKAEAVWDGESAPKVGPLLVEDAEPEPPAAAPAAKSVVGNPAKHGPKGGNAAKATGGTEHHPLKEHHLEHKTEHHLKGVKHTKGKEKER